MHVCGCIVKEDEITFSQEHGMVGFTKKNLVVLVGTGISRTWWMLNTKTRRQYSNSLCQKTLNPQSASPVCLHAVEKNGANELLEKTCC